MIPQGVQVFVALEAIDLRYSFDRLSGLAREQVGYDPRSGALFIFFGKRRDAVKILFFDGSGMCVFYKRLDKSTFCLPDAPESGARHVEVDEAMLDALLDGIAIEGPRKRQCTEEKERKGIDETRARH
jgi:transposase